ncbi:M1 family aminopeptidase [Massilia sp. YIM B02443]|uniref:ABC transporter permease/M1 family aminopeptidase n=1 Tax=Massilia sp. YIM B02443 TaxID=3050127 RepID=UPI0025B69227|nr:M1 family aminopeptidase [Massilia sp. YIM B02443]MDN4037412.1 M1 family aminopeptidase [Massilia sp. YIM B02443]
MLREFFKFELDFQLRQPLLWVCALIFGALAFGATTTDAIQVGGSIGNVNRNAPVVVAQLLGVFSLMSMFVVTIFIAGSVLRDGEVGIADMLFATPMKKRDYLVGRFGAGLVACLFIFVLIVLGMMLGPLMPWIDPQRVGPFPGAAYLWALGVIVVPNLFFIGALLMLLAATTRSIMMVYVGVMAFFVLWIVAGSFTSNIDNEWIAVLADPFGVRALGRATRYFSTAESNAGLPDIRGYMLGNRLLWSAVALALLGLTLALFKPQRAGTGKRLFGKAKAVAAAPAAPTQAALPRIEPRFGAATRWIQCWHILKFDAVSVFRSVPFLVMLLFGMLNMVGSSSQLDKMFGTDVYPRTHLMIDLLNGSFSFFLIIIVTFYAGELIFRERQARIADVSDAMPMPNWAPLVAKSLALVGVVLAFLGAGILTAIAIQLYRGGAPVELGVYIKGVFMAGLPYVLMALIAIVLQVVTNNKFIGYLLMIVLMIAQIVLSVMHFDHNLYNIGLLPETPYSDMNGFGHFLTGWAWFALYWTLFCVAALIVAQAFWVRGLSAGWRPRLRAALRRLSGSSGAALALCTVAFALVGGWIFHNTVTLDRYEAKDVTMDKQARYEKAYRRYKDLPHPKVTDVRAAVDIYPEQRRVLVSGSYVLQNKTNGPLDTLRLQRNADVVTTLGQLPPHRVILDDRESGFLILKLDQPLAPGASMPLRFTVDVRRPGYSNSGTPDTINLNGTFFNNQEFFPLIGYQPDFELTDRNERRKRGLGEPQRMAKLEDVAARANSMFGAGADWISFETTVSTGGDQIALAPGYLQKSWKENGRNFYHYKMDRKMMPFFAYLSANWQVKKGEWNGIPIEVYHDPKHGYNVERMIEATRKSLDYYTTQFTPYQHKQVRILEFPNYQSFAQSFANTIPFSESIGFIADLRKKEDIDYVFYVTAHEMAHQWWGHQVTAADVQGASMLIESLSQYSALMVMEKEYGRHQMRRFLRYELDRYLQSRGSEKIEELPLARVENQDYIHYRKGSLIFYRLRDEIGEEALNRALKRFLTDKGYQESPFTTSSELLDYIRAEAPASKHALIADMFEKIVFYDNRVLEASASKRSDGQWDVTMKLHLAKMQADGMGQETARAYDEPVEIGVFARAKGASEADERVLLLDKRALSGANPVVTVTVKEQPFEVGVDPYNKMIDRVSRDNRKEVAIE